MTELSEVDGNILDGVSATTLWTLHNRSTEAKRSDGVIRDPWAVTLSDRYTTPPMPFGLTAEEGLALADSVPGVRAARDIPLAQGRGMFKLAAWPPLDRVGLLRRIRPSMTLLEFGS